MRVNTEGWNKSNHIVLAVSTGVDSMVLLHQLITHLADSYTKLTCLHVNHNIRPAAAAEEQFIKGYCDKHQIPLHVQHLDLSAVIEKGNSIESAARAERYHWFDDMMIDGFQSVKKAFIETDKITDFRTAAYKVAIEKIALSYDFIGL